MPRPPARHARSPVPSSPLRGAGPASRISIRPVLRDVPDANLEFAGEQLEEKLRRLMAFHSDPAVICTSIHVAPSSYVDARFRPGYDGLAARRRPPGGGIAMKRLKLAVAAAVVAAAGSACDDAQIASANLSRAADNFEIMRRVVFLNGITDSYLLSIEGLCAIDDQGNQLEVTCKVSDGAEGYKKHFLGLSDNVSYFAEQLDAADVSAYHYRVIFKPQSILPDIDFRGSAGELLENSSENVR